MKEGCQTLKILQTENRLIKLLSSNIGFQGEKKDDFRVVGMKAKSTSTEAKAGATDTEDKAMDPKGRASSHRGLLLGLETYRNLPCWVSKLLGTADPFLPLNFSLLEWKCL